MHWISRLIHSFVDGKSSHFMKFAALSLYDATIEIYEPKRNGIVHIPVNWWTANSFQINSSYMPQIPRKVNKNHWKWKVEWDTSALFHNWIGYCITIQLWKWIGSIYCIGVITVWWKMNIFPFLLSTDYLRNIIISTIRI